MSLRFFSLLCGMVCLACSVQAQSLLLTNAQIVDPETQTITPGTLLIEGDRIVQQGTEAPANFTGDVWDLDGKWVIPGLNDMHTHSWGNMSPARAMEMIGVPNATKRMLYVGVTGFLDLFSPEAYIFNLRDNQRKEGFLGADIYAAGPIITCPGGHGTQYNIPTRTVSTPEEAVEVISDLAQHKPDVVKIVYMPNSTYVPSIDKATMEAVVATAKEHGLTTVSHVSSWAGARDVIQARVDAITHTPRGPVPEDILAMMKAQGVYSIPTLTVHSELFTLNENPEVLNNPLLQKVSAPHVLEAYGDTSAYIPRMKGWMRLQAAEKQGALHAVGQQNAVGIPLLTGSDSGNPGIFQGFSVHRELLLLVESGLSTWEALAASTIHPGGLLGQDFGVQAGDIANLVILNASPIEDIANTQNIAGVVYRGQKIDREALLGSN